MNSLSAYMGKIKAEKELKEKTETYVRAALSDIAYQNHVSGSEPESKRKRPAVRKLLIAVSSIAACLLLALGGNAYYHKPVSYVCVDINPSVELGINAFDRIVSAQAYNEDGRRLIDGQTYTNVTLEDALDSLIQAAAAQGFFFEDGSTTIALTAESDSETKAEELRASCEAEVKSALSAAGIHAVVFSDSTGLQFREQAEAAEISPGKLRLIRILQALAPDITAEEYQNARITDLLFRANALLSQPGNTGWQNGDYAAALERIRGAAAQVQEIYGDSVNPAENARQEPSGNAQQTQNQGASQPTQNQPPQNQDSDGSGQDQSQNQSSGPTQESQGQTSVASETQHSAPESGQTQSQQQEVQPQEQSQGPKETDSPLAGQEQSSDAPSEASNTEQGNGSDRQPASDPANTGATESGSPSGGQSGSGKNGG